MTNDADALVQPQVRDGWVRLVGISLFGVTIPRALGLFGGLGPSDARYWLGTVAFLALAAAIWQGNRWLLFRQQARRSWLGQPVSKLVALVFACTIYTAPLTAGCIAAWFVLADLPVDREALVLVSLVNVICVLFVTHAYETVFLIQARESDQLRVERLQRAAATAQLETLRQQVDPHFLFNSLNTLGALIDTDATKASAFCEALSDMYRYLLQTQSQPLVPLSDELSHLRAYGVLLALRFGGAVAIDIDGDAHGWVPPCALQTLVENASSTTVSTPMSTCACRWRSPTRMCPCVTRCGRCRSGRHRWAWGCATWTSAVVCCWMRPWPSSARTSFACVCPSARRPRDPQRRPVFGNVLIIEDEPPARDRLIRLLSEVAPELVIAGTPGSVAQTAAWLDAHPVPGLILCDIQLSDGSALSLFEARPVPCPIVFCTAYDSFVLDALEAGGVDYLLKPVKRERLEAALHKIERIARRAAPRAPRVLVKQGATVQAIDAADVAYFSVEHKMTLLVKHDKRSFYVDSSLSELEHQLSAHGFFRAGRGFLINRRAVTGYRALAKGRIAVTLEPSPPRDVTISQPRARAFRAFFARDSLQGND